MSESIDNSLYCVVARQLMTPDVLSVSEGWTVTELASFFAEYTLSGAPVISRSGDLVGVVSITDILRYTNNPQYSTEVISQQSFYNTNNRKLSSEIDNLKIRSERKVSNIMTRKIISVDAEAPLREVSELMSRNNIHRIFVTTEDKEIIGIISSMDLIRLLYQAAPKTA